MRKMQMLEHLHASECSSREAHFFSKQNFGGIIFFFQSIFMELFWQQTDMNFSDW